MEIAWALPCHFADLPALSGNIASVTDSRSRTRPPSAPSRQWRRPVPEEHINQHPIPVAAGLAALAGAALSLVIVFLLIMGVWLFATHGNESTSQVMRAAAAAWLGTQLVPVTIGTTTIGLLPWGFLVIPTYVLSKCMHWALKSAQPTKPRAYWQTAFIFSGLYAVVCAAVSLLASTDTLSTRAVDAASHGLVIGLLVSIGSVISYAPSRTILWDRLSHSVVTGLRIGLCAFALLAFVSATLTTASTIIHWSEIKSVVNVMAPGSVDSFFLMLSTIGYLPTASMWSLSYLVGPGIHLGGKAVVSLTVSHPGALPAFPLFSLLPNSAPSWGHYLVILPAALGVFIYFALPTGHWQPEGDDARGYFSNIVRFAELKALAAAIGMLGATSWLFMTISSGALGAQLLKFVGPRALDVAFTLMETCGATALFLLFVPRIILTLVRMWTTRERHTVVTDESDEN